VLVYRTAARQDDARRMLDAIEQRVLRLMEHGEVTRDAATELLLDAAELETAITDLHCDARDELSPECDALRAVSFAVARLGVARWRSRDAALTAECEAVRRAVRRLNARLCSGDGVGTLLCSVPEGFAYYALYPEMYAQAATRFAAAHAPSQVSVVGVRTIGAALSAVVAAALEAAGRDVASVTVRPRGHPYDRHLELGDALRSWVRARSGGWFVVVDEGPGISGSSFAAVTRALRECGADPARIALMPSWNAPSHQLRSESARAEWERYPRFLGSFEQLWLGTGALGRAWGGEVVADLSGGQWRAHFGGEAEAPAVHPQHERRKYLVRQANGAEIVVKFAGLGRYNRSTLSAAVRASAGGFGPRVVGVHGGFVGYERVLGAALTKPLGNRDELREIARYVAARSPVEDGLPGTSATELEEMVRVNVEGLLGAESARRALAIVTAQREAMATAPVVATDNRMQQHEWLRADGRLIKTDGDGHHNDHFLPGAQSAMWDLAGACEELVEAPEARQRLVAEYAGVSGDADAGARLAAYSVAYLAWRGGYCRMASDTLGVSSDGRGMAALAELYSRRLSLLLADPGSPSAAAIG
jgi:hypothetical protein